MREDDFNIKKGKEMYKSMGSLVLKMWLSGAKREVGLATSP
jgi:hypothetical protein